MRGKALGGLTRGGCSLGESGEWRGGGKYRDSGYGILAEILSRVYGKCGVKMPPWTRVSTPASKRSPPSVYLSPNCCLC